MLLRLEEKVNMFIGRLLCRVLVHLEKRLLSVRGRLYPVEEEPILISQVTLKKEDLPPFLASLFPGTDGPGMLDGGCGDCPACRARLN